MSADFGVDPAYLPVTGRGRRTVRRILLVVAIIIVGNLIVAITARWLDPQTSGPFGSSYVTTDEGVGAWHDLLAELGRGTDRLRMPLEDATVPRASTIVVVDPGPALTDAYVEALNQHARSGGRVLVVGVPELSAFGVQAQPGGTLDHDAITAGPLTADVTEVDADGGYEVSDGRLEVLVGSQTGAVAVRWEIGEGDIVALADPRIFTNERIDEEDNAVLAVRLTGMAAVTFDEYVHGYGQDTGLSGLGQTLLTVGVVALLAALMGMWAVGKRLGPPEQAERALPPSRGEYLDAMAANVHRAGDLDVYEVIRARSWRHVHRIAERYVGLPPDDQEAQAAQQLRLSRAEIDLLRRPLASKDDTRRLATVAAKIERQMERTGPWTS